MTFKLGSIQGPFTNVHKVSTVKAGLPSRVLFRVSSAGHAIVNRIGKISFVVGQSQSSIEPTTMALKLTTVAEYFLISIALYVLVLSPLIQPYLGSEEDGDLPVISYEKSEALVYPDLNLQCPRHTFATHILSRDPLIIYLPSFLSDEEAEELVSIRCVPFRVTSLLFS